MSVEIKSGEVKDAITQPSAEERYYMASQWTLMWRKFIRHRLAIVSTVLLGLMCFFAITYEFWTPYEKSFQHKNFLNAPPHPHPYIR